MSDTSDRTEDLRLSVASTLNEAIGMVDAEPTINDFIAHLSLPTYTTRAILLHSALELGMKCLRVDGELTDSLIKKFHSWGHNLVKIYRGLSDSDRELLDKAFKDAVSFYGFQVNRDEWTHMSDFDTYLAETGDKGLFLNFRYWYFEGDSRLFGSPMPDLLINREMARFISDALTGRDNLDGGPFSVSRLVNYQISETLRHQLQLDNASMRRFNEDPQGYETDCLELFKWLREHSSLLLALKDAYVHNFDVLNEWNNTVLSSVYASLKKTNDSRIRLALNYAFKKFDAKSSGCDREVISSAHIPKAGRRRTVRTPSGRILGSITERHDGLWMVEDALAIWQQLAFGRDDAIGLLIEDGTERVSVALNGGAPVETRSYFPAPYPYRFSGEEVLCEFWDANHGIVMRDEIRVRVIRQAKMLPNLIIRGIVKSVKDHEIRIAVSN